MTQWILASETCSCARNPQVSEKSNSTNTHETEIELAVDKEKFPIERYKPIRIIGEGSSGIVFLARDRLLTKKVAVKVLKVIDSTHVVSFQNEARVTSQLNHRNIARVVDFGKTTGETPYMVLDYIQGMSLEQKLYEEANLSVEDTVEIFGQILDALSYAHNKNILHRDLKPSNVIVNSLNGEYQVRLVDFGTAKIAEDLGTTVTIGGTTLVGTPAYMSPDQANGRKFDSRSDLYSVGCMLFESITGSRPFSAESPLEIISLHASQPPPLLTDFVNSSAAVSALEAVINRALEKDPSLRYQRASHFKVALKSVLDSTDSPGVGIGKSAGSKRSFSVLLVSGLVLSILVFGIVFLQHSFVAAENKREKIIKTALRPSLYSRISRHEDLVVQRQSMSAASTYHYADQATQFFSQASLPAPSSHQKDEPIASESEIQLASNTLLRKIERIDPKERQSLFFMDPNRMILSNMTNVKAGDAVFAYRFGSWWPAVIVQAVEPSNLLVREKDYSADKFLVRIIGYGKRSEQQIERHDLASLRTLLASLGAPKVPGDSSSSPSEYFRLDDERVTREDSTDRSQSRYYVVMNNMPFFLLLKQEDYWSFSRVDLRTADLSRLLGQVKPKPIWISLSAQQCLMSESNFQTIAKVPSIRYLKLSDCHGLDESGIKLLQKSHLKSISLCGDYPSKVLRALPKQVGTLRLERMQLSSDQTIDASLRAKALEHLSISECIVGQNISGSLSNSGIVSLSLENCHLERGFVERVAGRNLMDLNLKKTYLTAEEIHSISRNRQLRRLSLSNVVDDDTTYLSRMRLTDLTISDSPKISVEGLRRLGTMKSLKYMSVDSSVSEDIKRDFRKSNLRFSI